jgi:hypothetical protein
MRAGATIFHTKEFDLEFSNPPPDQNIETPTQKKKKRILPPPSFSTIRFEKCVTIAAYVETGLYSELRPVFVLSWLEAGE